VYSQHNVSEVPHTTNSTSCCAYIQLNIAHAKLHRPNWPKQFLDAPAVVLSRRSISESRAALRTEQKTRPISAWIQPNLPLMTSKRRPHATETVDMERKRIRYSSPIQNPPDAFGELKWELRQQADRLSPTCDQIAFFQDTIFSLYGVTLSTVLDWRCGSVKNEKSTIGPIFRQNGEFKSSTCRSLISTEYYHFYRPQCRYLTPCFASKYPKTRLLVDKKWKET
jgi:hypothetical protein